VNIHEAFRFDPGSNVWTGIAPYPGESGWSGASFELNGRVFGGLGRTIFPMSGYHTDWWEMVRSNDVGVQEDTDIHKELRIFPNPSRSGDMVRPELDESMLRGPFWMSISDASGRLVTSSMITNEGNLVPDGLAPGLYRLSIVSAGMIHTATLVRLR
jgi:hypothetical protein